MQLLRSTTPLQPVSLKIVTISLPLIACKVGIEMGGVDTSQAELNGVLDPGEV
jgi:hypothetical protein